jgi:hypothetical protein
MEQHLPFQNFADTLVFNQANEGDAKTKKPVRNATITLAVGFACDATKKLLFNITK